MTVSEVLSDTQRIIVSRSTLIYHPSVSPANEWAFMHMCARMCCCHESSTRLCDKRLKSCTTQCGPSRQVFALG